MSGIYHSAGNTISIAAFHEIAREGILGEEWLCKAHPEWADDDSFFARCGAGVRL